jgi:tetratricopeptide (TPR) repeat protein
LQEAVAMNDAGYHYYRLGKWDLAEEKFSSALTLNRLIDRREGIAANLNNLGAMAQERGDLDAAEARFQEALTLRRSLGEPAGLCEALNNLGALRQAQGRLKEAEEAYLEALAYAEQFPPGPLLALTLTHLGDVAREGRDFAGALDLYCQAQKLDEAGKDRQGRARRRARLGRTYLAMQNYGEAGLCFREALWEFRALEDTGGIADALDGLTRLALALGDREQAKDYGGRLLKIYEARGQEKEAKNLQSLF